MNYGYTNIVEYGYIDKEEEGSEPTPNISWVEFSGEKNYTIENSIEYTTRNMVLEGETIQNLCTKLNSPYNVSDFANGQNNHVPLVFKLQLGKTYSIKLNVSKYNNTVNTEGIAISFSNGSNSYKFAPNSDFISFVATDGDISLDYLIMYFTDGQLSANATIESIMILEGDWTNKEIPEYFEGIKSVGEDDNKISILSCGKNLYNPQINDIAFNYENFDNISVNGYYSNVLPFTLKAGKTYKISINKVDTSQIQGYIYLTTTEDGAPLYFIHRENVLITEVKNTISPKSNCNLIIRCNKKEPTDNVLVSVKESINFIQIEEGTTLTSYETYKEDKKDILLPFDGGLKGIGSVKDEMSSITNKVVQRIGKRSYQENDELLENVITDKTNTYYILENPIEYDLVESINLNTYNKVTHIITEATSSFEIPLEIDAVVSNLISENQSLKVRTTSLEEENQALQEDVTKAQEDANSALMGIAELYETTL